MVSTYGARASRPPIMERGRPARHDPCGQDARAPQRTRPQRRPRIMERGCLGRYPWSAGVPPAMTHAGKMPALHKGLGLNAARESWSAGVPPAMTHAGKMPALHKGLGLNAARESWSAGVSAAIHGARASRPQNTIAARSPVNGTHGSARDRNRYPASNAGPEAAYGGQGPSTGLGIGRFPNPAPPWQAKRRTRGQPRQSPRVSRKNND